MKILLTDAERDIVDAALNTNDGVVVFEVGDPDAYAGLNPGKADFEAALAALERVGLVTVERTEDEVSVYATGDLEKWKLVEFKDYTSDEAAE